MYAHCAARARTKGVACVRVLTVLNVLQSVVGNVFQIPAIYLDAMYVLFRTVPTFCCGISNTATIDINTPSSNQPITTQDEYMREQYVVVWLSQGNNSLCIKSADEKIPWVIC